MSFTSYVKRFFKPRESHRVDRYHVAAVTHPGELLLPEGLPLEVRFVLANHPERMETFRSLFESGFGIAVRTVDHTPESVLKAVDAISHLTQENTIIPWLPELLRGGELPVFSEEELRAAEKQGIALYEQARLIVERRFEFKKFVLIDLQNRGLGEAERELMRSLNEELYPYALDYIINRIVFDNAHTRTEVAQSIIKAMVVIGPIAHALEHVARGIGKLFAASADDILAEVAELFALRGSGFTWRQLAKRSRILIPVFFLATYGALSVEPLIQQGRIALAGAVFGLSAVALSLTTAIQSIGLYHQAYARLQRQGKLPQREKPNLWKLALRQDFTNPARLGLFIGAFAAPIMAAAVFVLFTEWVHNGWILALLGSVESVVAGLTVITALRLNRLFFRRRMQKEILHLARR